MTDPLHISPRDQIKIREGWLARRATTRAEPSTMCLAKHTHKGAYWQVVCSCSREPGHPADYHEDASVPVRWTVEAPVPVAPAPPTREWLTARLIGLAVSASLESLTLAVSLLEALPGRDIGPEALMAAQRAREDETDDLKRTVGPWRDDGGHWMVVRETPDRTDYAACASDGAWTVYAYEENPDPEEPAEPFADGYEDGIEANQAAADAHLLAAGWTGRIRDREVDPDAAALGRALALVVREVESARLKHGRGFPGGWGPSGRLVDRAARQRAQDACDAAADDGKATYRHVEQEEAAEVYAEVPGTPEHRAELVQHAAVILRGLLVAMGSEVQGG